MVRSVAVPQHSEIAKHLAGAQAFDAFAAPLAGDRRPALEICIDILAGAPAWIDRLMAVRNRAVAPFGLKQLAKLGDIDTARTADSYRAGDKLGIFTIVFLSQREVVLAEDDRHLAAKISVCLDGEDDRSSVILSTAIHVRNLLGCAYLLAVWPAHKLMFPALLARFSKIEKQGAGCP